MDADISGTVAGSQQCRFWTSGRPVISVATMPTSPSRKAKPTPADNKAAERLRKLWLAAVAESKTDPSQQVLTQEIAAEDLGVNQSAVSQYINGLIPLNYRAVLGFARLLNVDPTAIRSDLPEQQLDRRSSETTDNGEWADIVGYAQAVGLGAGPEAQEYAETHKLKFRADSLARKRLNPHKLAVMYGSGDSMFPRVLPGDAILFDTSDTRPRDGLLYVILVQGAANKEYQVKRCLMLDDDIYFVADNPAGDHAWKKPKRMDAKRHPIEVIGRVRWIGSWED